MKKILIILVVGFFTSLLASAQTSDSAYTSGGNSEVYYSFKNGVVKTVDNNNWDLAFEMKGFLSGIHVNEQAGAQVFVSPFAVADWSNFDTTGMSTWEISRNSTETWSEGGFNSNISSEYDLGWGQYDINTHSVKGDSVYLLKTRSGSFQKVYIKSLANSTYTFVYADVDGSNEMTQTIVKGDFPGVNFAYYDFDKDASLNREPVTTEWDIVFTKYPIGIQAGPDLLYYPVIGAKINKGYEVSERNGMDVMDNDTSTLSWNSIVTEIGSDWKDFNGMAYEIIADRAYFVRTATGSVWKIYFTDYKGGPSGTCYFTTELVGATVGIQEFKNNISIYPNPASEYFTIEQNDQLESVSLLDANGRIIRSWAPQGSYSVKGITAGLYYLTTASSKGLSVRPLLVR